MTYTHAVMETLKNFSGFILEIDFDLLLLPSLTTATAVGNEGTTLVDMVMMRVHTNGFGMV